MDFYRNILFVFPKEKCLLATFVDLQKKSNSSRDSNSVLQILHQGECECQVYFEIPKVLFLLRQQKARSRSFSIPLLGGVCVFNVPVQP